MQKLGNLPKICIHGDTCIGHNLLQRGFGILGEVEEILSLIVSSLRLRTVGQSLLHDCLCEAGLVLLLPWAGWDGLVGGQMRGMCFLCIGQRD